MGIWSVRLPLHGYATIEVEAGSEDEAIENALNEATIDDADWSFGEVGAEAEELEGEEEDA